MAFALGDYITREAKDDPKLVKWLATYIVYENNDGVEKRSQLLHPCTAEEFKRFNPPDRRSMDRARLYKENGGLFCLDCEKAG